MPEFFTAYPSLEKHARHPRKPLGEFRLLRFYYLALVGLYAPGKPQPGARQKRVTDRQELLDCWRSNLPGYHRDYLPQVFNAGIGHYWSAEGRLFSPEFLHAKHGLRLYWLARPYAPLLAKTVEMHQSAVLGLLSTYERTEGGTTDPVSRKQLADLSGYTPRTIQTHLQGAIKSQELRAVPQWLKVQNESQRWNSELMTCEHPGGHCQPLANKRGLYLRLPNRYVFADEPVTSTWRRTRLGAAIRLGRLRRSPSRRARHDHIWLDRTLALT